MSLAFIFPGQGSQSVGMGAELAAFRCAREVFEEVDHALGQHLYKLMREGPADELTLTENAQPALMAVSLAVMRTLREEMGAGVDGAAFVAGHSLGEYSALCAVDALSLGQTAVLLKLRGQAMQRAVPVGEGAMASLIGPKTDVALAEEAARAGRRDRRLRRRQRQQPGQRGDLRDRRGGGARHRPRQGTGRPRHSPERLRALPLPLDAARRRRDGLSARRGARRPAERAAGGQRHRPPHLRPRRDQAPPRRAGDWAACAGARAWSSWRGKAPARAG